MNRRFLYSVLFFFILTILLKNTSFATNLSRDNNAAKKSSETSLSVSDKNIVIKNVNGNTYDITVITVKSEDEINMDRINSGIFRTVRIDGPVDVEIYDKNNILIGSIINDERVVTSEYKLFGVSEDGEKQASLPLNASYTIKIKATDKGTVSYGVVEEHHYRGTAKILNFDNIAIEKGTVLKAYAPEFSKEDLDNNDGTPSSTHYTLFNETENKEILPTSEYLMDDAKNYRTTIDVETEDIRKGSAQGRGQRITNAPARVYAIPAKGYMLEGWYENGVKVSKKYVYTTKADRYRKLTAKFVPIDEETRIKMKKEEEEYNKREKEKELEKTNYTDIKGEKAERQIKYLEDEGILSLAYNSEVFRPKRPVTRAELISMVVKIKKLKITKYRDSFKDVDEYSPFADVIQTAVDNNIVKGYKDGTFKADKIINKAEMALILSSIESKDSISEDETKILSKFNDKDKIPKWSQKYVAWAVKNNIIEGNDGNLNVHNYVSRAEICMIIYKILTENIQN